MTRAVLVAMSLALAGCGGGGMGKAAYDTGRLFDKYGCLSKEAKGEKPCDTVQ